MSFSENAIGLLTKDNIVSHQPSDALLEKSENFLDKRGCIRQLFYLRHFFSAHMFDSVFENFYIHASKFQRRSALQTITGDLMKYNALSLIVFFFLTTFSNTSDAQLKKRIAVSRFDDRSGSGYNHVGVGVSDMLTTALVKSGKFVVIERAEFDKVLEEQKLGQSGVVTPESAPKVGKALGVELLVIGSVSEFGTKQNTVSGGVSIFGGGITKKTARAAVDIRLVNTTTGEVVAAEKEEGSESTTGLSVRYEDMDFSDASNWNDTDIGKACREAIDGAAKLIVDNMEKIPWSGKVLKVNTDGTLLMKPGSEGNVSVGDEFVVFREGEELKDPDTGASLGSEETKVGSIKVIEDALKGKASKAKITDGTDIKVGDIVRQKK